MKRGKPISKTIRALVWERDRGCCVVCGVGLDPDFWECHHRRFRSRGGKNTVGNLIAVCREHHVSIHMDTLGIAAANGWAVSQFGDCPELIPVRYFDGEVRYISNGVAA